ncbi:MAG: ArsR/SmtB family transcription factor [Acidimicrobiales bacterium]
MSGEKIQSRTATGSLDIKPDLDLCRVTASAAPLAAEDAADLAHLIGALADPVRLRLLSILASKDEVCSCELEGPLGKSQPTISHHTKVLSEAGLISGEKRGRWTWWHSNPERLAAILTALGG